MNPFEYSFNNKRYHTLNYHYQNKFNSKVFKVSLNAGFTCPNIDGKVGYGGCIYCSKDGSGEKLNNTNQDLLTQFEQVKRIMERKWPNSKYIGYFQANSNTYAPLNVLKEKYELILKQKNVVGLNIATRPDCIEDDVLEYLADLSRRTYLTIELGLQTIHEKTSKLINRGHDLKCFEETVEKLRKRKINVVIHIINGLPYETKEMMLKTARYLAKLDIQGIKIHMLHIIKDTPLVKMYQSNPFPLLTQDEYVDIVCDQLEILPSKIVIHRITGDPLTEELVAPTWVIKKFVVLNAIDKEIRKRDSYQGFNQSILNRFRQLLNQHVKEKDIVIDATVGNGKDALTLSKLVPKGHVYGFDIQKEAIINTQKLLNEKNIANFTLYNQSHANMDKLLPNLNNKVSAIVFNLGYLPGGDKSITTDYKTSIKAIEKSLRLLNNKGICLIVVYPGHKEGKMEDIKIKEYLVKQNYNYAYYYNTDNKEAPYLICIKRDPD